MPAATPLSLSYNPFSATAAASSSVASPSTWSSGVSAAAGKGSSGGATSGISKEVLKSLQDVVWSEDEVSAAFGYRHNQAWLWGYKGLVQRQMCPQQVEQNSILANALIRNTLSGGTEIDIIPISSFLPKRPASHQCYKFEAYSRTTY